PLVAATSESTSGHCFTIGKHAERCGTETRGAKTVKGVSRSMGPVGVEPYVGPPAASRAQDAFISQWDSSIAGATPSGSIQLPLVPAGTYDFTVHWGDGTSDHISAWNSPAKVHVYAQPGEYT